ncbi:hypothetical protein MBLNU230_g7680t1 [Neophaeotheca triangularis]
MGFMGLVFDRIAMMIINILFPPLTVMILSGFGWDLILNCLFFLAAVIPAHIHGFYISMTYFHRKSKVQKGKYPGGRKSLIESKNVLRGGASKAEYERLWEKEHGGGSHHHHHH